MYNMKHFTLLSGKGLIIRLALALIMIATWGGQVWAEDIVVVNGSSVSEGWIISNMTLGVDEIHPISNWTSGNITSENTITTDGEQRIIIKAKRYTDKTTVTVKIQTSSDNKSFTDIQSFDYHTTGSSYKHYEIYSSEDYIELISDKLAAGTKYIRIDVNQAYINKIDICGNKKLVLDENTPTAIIHGSKSESVYLKYTPKNGWNTICVPFQLKSGSQYNHLSTIFGEGYSVFTLSSFSGGTLTFTNALPNSWNSINAFAPILVYAESVPNCPSDGFELTSNVTISYPQLESGRAKTADGVTFQGTFAPKAAGSLEGCYGVTRDGQIAKGSDKAWMNGYRAYLTGIPDGSSVKMFVIDGDDATDVGLMQMVEGEDKAVYNISGQRVQKARKGLYIIGGKKVIIK